MKVAKIILISLFALSLAGCSTSEKTVEQSEPVLKNSIPSGAIAYQPDYFRDIADFLYRMPGVNVSGPSSNPTVTIRGISSFSSNIEPLYVIDGQPAGTNYVAVNRMLNIRDVSYVRVLKGSEAAIYGVRGSNGIIEIVTKR